MDSHTHTHTYTPTGQSSGKVWPKNAITNEATLNLTAFNSQKKGKRRTKKKRKRQFDQFCWRRPRGRHSSQSFLEFLPSCFFSSFEMIENGSLAAPFISHKSRFYLVLLIMKLVGRVFWIRSKTAEVLRLRLRLRVYSFDFLCQIQP